MVSLLICATRWLVYDVLFLCLFVFFTRTRMIHTYSSYVLWSKTRMRCGLLYIYTTFSYWGPCWSKALVLICMIWWWIFRFFIEIFYFFSRYIVVGSRYDFFFGFNNMPRNTSTNAGRILFDTKRKRENSRVWPCEVRVMLLLDR